MEAHKSTSISMPALVSTQMNHNSTFGIFIMIIASIFIGYYLTMTVILRDNNTDNLNRMYQGLLMGFWMGLIELLMVGFLMNIWMPFYTFLLIILVIGIVILTYLIYNQVGINENQFMLSMISHHQMAIDMTKEVKPKTTDPKLISIMDNILESQQREIDQMKDILNEKGVPNNITAIWY